jgi:hypothetical protein
LNLNDHLEVEFHSMVILDHDYWEVLLIKELNFSNKHVNICLISIEVELNIEVQKLNKHVI